MSENVGSCHSEKKVADEKMQQDEAKEVAQQNTNTASSSSNPFKSAFHRLAKRADKSKFSTSAAASFFSRGKTTSGKTTGVVPGTTRPVCGAQLPPVWHEVPPPAALNSSLDTSIGGNSERKRRISYNAENAPDPERIGSARLIEFHSLLSAEVVQIDKLKELSWGGVPADYRATVWQLLLGYLPSKKERRDAALARKRQDYTDCVRQYYSVPDNERTVGEQKILRQILVDIPRTNPEDPLFQHPVTQHCMERVLYIWAIRHPASGYVQGINDILTPFFVVFLSAYEEPTAENLAKLSETELQSIEADCYWCMTKLLDDMQDHYTLDQPGLQRMVFTMEEIVKRCDAELHEHLVETEAVQFVQFAFRWMNCLLMREIPLCAIVRLWDTYFSDDAGFERFHIYVSAAVLMTFGDLLKPMSFQDIMLFLQDLPTKDWTETHVEPILSRAFILKTYFDRTIGHLTKFK